MSRRAVPHPVAALDGRITMRKTATAQQAEPLAVSLRTLAEQLDAHRSTVRRWLKEAGIRPIAIGRGANGAIRYRWPEVRAWLDSLDTVE